MYFYRLTLTITIIDPFRKLSPSMCSIYWINVSFQLQSIFVFLLAHICWEEAVPSEKLQIRASHKIILSFGQLE